MTNKQIKIGTLISYISIFISILIGLFYTPWIVKSIGKNQYGIYSLANSLITLFMVDFGLSSATGRYVSNYHAENDQNKIDNLMGAIYKLYGLLDFIILIIFIIFYIFIDNIYINLTSEELHYFKVVFIIVCSYNLISFPFLTFNGILIAYEKFIQLKFADLLYKILIVIFTIIVLSLNAGLYALVIANTLAGTIIILYKFFIIHKNTNIKPNYSFRGKKLFKEIFGFSIWITITSLANRLVFTITPSILGIVSSASSIAVFGIITTIEGYTYSITTAINGMFMPKISKSFVNNNENFSAEITPLFINVGRFNFAVNALIIVGLINCGKDFILLWMGESFSEAYHCCILVILPGLLYNSLQIANTSMIVKNKVKYQAIIAIITGVINIIFSFILSKKYGVIGASISIFIALLIKAMSYIYVNQKKMGFDMKLFAKKCYIKMLPCFVLPLLFGFIINYYYSNISWWSLIIKSFITCILFFLSLLVCFKKEEINKFLSKIKRS